MTTEQPKRRGRPPMNRPSVQSESQRELDKAEKQLDAFENEIKTITKDRVNEGQPLNSEPQTKLSSKEIDKSKDIYLKPTKTISTTQKFNEKFRDKYNFAKEYVHFIAENKEIIGESIEIWTRPFGGMSAEFWTVPCNKPVWGPRYLAEQIKRKFYHRMVMDERKIVDHSSSGQFFGSMIADTTIQRLDAIPVSSRKSVFMGANN